MIATLKTAAYVFSAPHAEVARFGAQIVSGTDVKSDMQMTKITHIDGTVSCADYLRKGLSWKNEWQQKLSTTCRKDE